MKRRLFKIIICLTLLCLNKMVVNADNCYFNVLEKEVYKNDTITVELGLKEYISFINNAKLFLEYDENALELNNKKILVNNGWNKYNAEIISDNSNVNTLAITIGTNNPSLYLNQNSNLVLLKIEFKIKEDYYNSKTSIYFSPSKDHGYFNSKSIIYNKEDETNNINCDTKEIELTIKENTNKPLKKENNNQFIIYFLTITMMLAIISIIIVINNVKADKK